MILQAIGLIGGAMFLFFMGVKTSVWLVYLMFVGWGFFRAFFDANIYSVLYDVTPGRLPASCSSAMNMTGFAVGAFAPVVLGALKQNMGSLSSTFPILGIIWLISGILMYISARLHYNKDYQKHCKDQ